MPKISLAAVQQAVSQADDRFANHSNGFFNVMDNGNPIPVSYNGKWTCPGFVEG